MSRGGRIKRVFPGGNTAQGFYSFYDSVLQGLEHIFIIKGGPGTGKSTLMRRIGLAMADRGYDVEFLCCSSDNDSLDGVIIPEIKLGLVDGTAPHIVDPKNPGVVDEILNLGEFWNERYLRSHGDEIIDCNHRVWKNFEEAYKLLAEAKVIHDELESYYLAGMDFDKADQITNELIGEIFTRQPVVKHLFASAITPEGVRNYIDNITQDIKTRYIIKGRPGTGKSVLTNKVAQAAVEQGYSIEMYHCEFDPDSVDMLLIPELSIALIDGTAPHVIEDNRAGDKIIDMLQCLNLSIIEDNFDKLTVVEESFNEKMKKAISFIANAKKVHDEMEAFYIAAMNFEALDAFREKIFNRILGYAAEKKHFN